MSSTGLQSSSAPMGGLGLRLGDQGHIGEFSRILECFDSTYENTLPRNPKMSRFATFSLGWGYAMVP